MMSSLLNNCLLLVRGKLLQGAINIIKTAFFSARLLPRDREAWGLENTTVYSASFTRGDTSLLRISFGARSSSRTNFPLCTVTKGKEKERVCRTVPQHLPGTDSGGSGNAAHKDVMHRRKKRKKMGFD